LTAAIVSLQLLRRASPLMPIAPVLLSPHSDSIETGACETDVRDNR
jgi:hypothetical protein